MTKELEKIRDELAEALVKTGEGNESEAHWLKVGFNTAIELRLEAVEALEEKNKQLTKEAEALAGFVGWYASLDHQPHCEEGLCTCGVELSKELKARWQKFKEKG